LSNLLFSGTLAILGPEGSLTPGLSPGERGEKKIVAGFVPGRCPHLPGIFPWASDALVCPATIIIFLWRREPVLDTATTGVFQDIRTDAPLQRALYIYAPRDKLHRFDTKMGWLVKGIAQMDVAESKSLIPQQSCGAPGLFFQVYGLD